MENKEKTVAIVQEEPTISFTRMIEVAPNGTSFSGWGPKIVGMTSILNRWN
jgi:hypothetical protein